MKIKMKNHKLFPFLAMVTLLSSCNFIDGMKRNTIKEGFVYIPRGANFEQVMDSLTPFLKDVAMFRRVAEAEDYPSTIKSGKYKINANDQNKALISRLQSGEQVETKLQIRNHPTLFHMAGAVSKQIDADSISIVQAVMSWAHAKDSTLTEETVKQFFIPETYFVYWNLTPKAFVERMEKEYNKIWTSERLNKAKTLDFTPLEVVTLASIVQLESSDNYEEQQKVAKAYMNRLDKGMRLEADPTAIYAYKLQNGFDHKIQRVYYKWLNSASEYNTYRVTGLPPAPICLPNMRAVDAVLNPADHQFVFFCADPDRPGFHNFTNSYQEHLQNAAKYRAWVKANNIQ